MTETAVKANATEAYHLYRRGVAAARGGHRRVAAGLLTRSIQLDPHNEQTWLWLSGVLDDPQQVAFCLQSVLKLNPANERARQGLQWLEERKLLNGNGNGGLKHTALDITVETPASQPESHSHHESWWVKWRQSRRETSRMRLIFWIVPIVLLCISLVLYETFTIAVQQSQATARPLVVASAKIREGESSSAGVPILESEPASVRASQTISYLNALEPIRQRLRDAVDSYLNATGQPGGASVGHVTAAQTLRATVEQAHKNLSAMTPPTDLKNAHDDYLKGLELEMQALDVIAEFYGSYKVELANRAALRLQEAKAHIDRARAVFDAHKQQIQIGSLVASQTVR